MSPSQGLPASKPVEGLRTFGVEDVKGALLLMLGSKVAAVSLMWAESPKKNCQP